MKLHESKLALIRLRSELAWSNTPIDPRVQRYVSRVHDQGMSVRRISRVMKVPEFVVDGWIAK